MAKTDLMLPDGAVQIGVHGKGGGVDINNLKLELTRDGMMFAENDTHLIWWKPKK